MKKFLLIFMFYFSIASAQEVFSGKPVYINNNETVEVGIGVPVIFTNKDAPKDEFTPEQAQWRPQLPMVEINAFAGQRIQVPFLTHIPAFTAFVQILPDKTAVVTERIVLISDKPINRFKKEYQKTSHEQNINFLFASSNGQNINPIIEDTSDNFTLKFFDNEGLPSGVYLIEITYEISNAVQIDGVLARLSLPLIDSNNPYIMERGQVLITYPENTKFMDAKALYGKNDIASDRAGNFYQDENDHLIYKMNGLLPTGIGMKLQVISNGAVFTNQPETLMEKTENYFWIIVLFLGCLIIYVYLYFAGLDLKDQFSSKSFINKIRSKMKYDIILLRPLVMGKTDARAFLIAVLSLLQKKNISINIQNERLILLKKEKSKIKLHKKILHYLFSKFKQQTELSQLDWNKKGWKKFKSFIEQAIRLQSLQFIKREICISILLCALILGFIYYLQANTWQLITAFLFLAFFLYFQTKRLQKKSHIRGQLSLLFKDYTSVLKTPERQFLTDIALENKIDVQKLTPFEESVNIPYNTFETLFLEQLTVKEKK